MTKAKDLEGGGHPAWGGKHQRKVGRNPRWVSGELPGWRSEGRETGHNERERRPAVAGESARGEQTQVH